MEVRRLLNRIVASSVSDAVFMAEARRLAEAQPGALLAGCLTCASIDVAQAELMHSLLTRLPALVDHVERGTRHPLLLHRLRQVLDQELPSARQRAVLLFTARLTGAATSGSSDDAFDDDDSGERPRTAEDARSEAASPLVGRNALLAVSVLSLLPPPLAPTLTFTLTLTLTLIRSQTLR